VYSVIGNETLNSVLVADALPAFTGLYTITVSRTAATATLNAVLVDFVRGSDSVPCHTQQYAIVGGESSLGPITSEVGSGAWPCTDWTFWQVKRSTGSMAGMAGMTLTVIIDAADLPDVEPPHVSIRSVLATIVG